MNRSKTGSKRLSWWPYLLKNLDLLQEALSRPTRAHRVFVALMLFGIFYRSVVYIRLYTEQVTPLSFVPTAEKLFALPIYLALEIVFALALSLPIGVLSLTAARFNWRGAGPVISILSYTLLLLIGFISGAHLDLLFETHTGLTLASIVGAVSTGSPFEVVRYATPIGKVTFVMPLVFYLVLGLLPRRFDQRRGRALVGILVVLALAQIPWMGRFALRYKILTPRPALAAIPAVYLAGDVVSTLTREEGRYEKMACKLPALAGSSLRLPDSSENTPVEAILSRPASSHGKQEWNVVVVIMESTGARYVFDKKLAGVVPMPFLKSLASQGAQLTRHYSTSNSSPRSIFSIFSGIYPVPDLQMFCTRPDVAIPSLATFLGDSYEKFLVTPGYLQTYFPLSFLQNSGLKEIRGAKSLPASTGRKGGEVSNELDGVDFFIKRLKRAKEPFFATYYSVVPHFPYEDYGAEYRISEGDEKLDKYYNNLRLLDSVIERIVAQVEAAGQGERTAFLFVGDHGEAFGQHKGNWGHSHKSFDENLRVPAIFYQPKLFAAEKLKELTSHVDLLPTLLDAIGRDVPVNTIQGSSLFSKPAIMYRYFFGNEDTLSSVSRDGIKLQVSFRKDKCYSYNLNTDPKEKKRKSCRKHGEQLDDLLQFWRFQRKRLPGVNKSLRGMKK